jgi:hypothetical protein
MNMRIRMRTTRPPALTAKEQAQRHEERFATEAAASERLGVLVRQPVDDESARIRRLQQALGIVRFDDLPAAKPLLEIDRVLKAHAQRIADETALIHTERYLAGSAGASGAVPPKGAKAQEFREKRDRLKAKLKVGAQEPAKPQPGDLPGSVVRALAVFESNAPKDRPTQGARLAELADMQIVVEDGISAVRILIDEQRRDASYDEAQKLQKRHGELSVLLFRAAQAFAEAAEAERSLRSAHTSAGYSPRYDVLPGLQLGAVLVLGTESDYASQISQYRRFLQSKGLIK